MIKNYLQLVPRYLTSNKKTSISMVISILFSVAMLVSVGMVIGKYNATRLEMAKEGHGNYHGGYRFVEEDTLGKLKRFEGIKEVGTTLAFGELTLDSEKLQIHGTDTTAIKLLNAKALKGKVPEKENEIAIEERMYNKLEKKPQIGEKFRLSYFFTDPVGKRIQEANTEFIFCGILEDFEDSKFFQTGNAYVTLETAKSLTTNLKRVYQQWFTIKDSLPVEDTLTKINKYAFEKPIPGEHIIEGVRPNPAFISAIKEARIAQYITIIFNFIVALAVAMVIYNVFNISVLQRKKHYGLLRAIGITPKQIKVMLFFEAFLYEVIVVPIGVVIGILSTNLIMRTIGGDIFKGSILKAITPSSILLPVFVSLISICAAVYSPAKLASKVSPIESMTMEDIKNTKKLQKTFKAGLLDRLIGYTGKMAISNISRYKKRFLATVIASGVGIALFICAMYIIDFLNPISFLKNRVKADYELTFSHGGAIDNYGYSEESITKIKNLPGVKSVEKFKYYGIDYILGLQSMTESAIKQVENKKNPAGVSLMWGGYHVVSQVYGCSDEFMQSLRDSVHDKNNNAQVFIVQNLNNENFTKIKSGDEVSLFNQYLKNGKFVDFGKDIKIDYVLDKLPMKVNELNGYIATFVPYKFFEDNFNLQDYQQIEINVEKGADLNKIEQELQIVANSWNYGKLVSYQKEVEKYRNYQMQVGTILISLATIIAIVGLINIMNTLNMNIIIRKREFGMLRALGMTKKEMKKILLKEAALYGICSSIIGIGLGYLLIWLVYNVGHRKIEMKFYIDFKVVLLTFIITIILSIFSSILPLRKAVSTDIVESIQAVE